jgi:ADP-ribose pyrophosphatase
MAHETISTERVFDGDYLRLERRLVRLPDGLPAPREIVVVQDAVAALPLRRDGTAYFVRQYRPAIGRDLLEVPAGLLDPGEEREDAVRRELREEIGMAPRELRHLLTYYHAEGYSTGVLHLYLAWGLEDAGGPAPDEGEFLELVALPFEEAYARVLAGEFNDSKSLLSILYTERLVRTGEIGFAAPGRGAAGACGGGGGGRPPRRASGQRAAPLPPASPAGK